MKGAFLSVLIKDGAMVLRFVTLFTALFLMAALPARADVLPPSLKPEAPVSPYIARDQAALLSDLFAELDDRDYAAAKRALFALEDPLAKRIGTWALLRSGADGISLKAYERFLHDNPGWPNSYTLQNRGEALIDDDTPAASILSFFAVREPHTGFGKLHLARALFEVGRDAEGRDSLRKAWTEHNFTSADSADILRCYGDHLTEEDHFAKADRALFRRSTSGTEDVGGLLSETRAAEVEARKELLRGRERGLRLFNALPEESKRDAGVLHAVVRYLRRDDREEEAIELAGLAPLDPDALRDPGSWHYERKLLARWALEEGRFTDAYTLSAYSGLKEGADFAEAEFMAGWVALRFLADPQRARAHFAFLTDGVSSPISLARGNYWLGRAYQTMGDESRARAHYLVAADYPYTFYGQLAIETLGPRAPVYGFPDEVVPAKFERGQFEARELVQALHILDHIDEYGAFRRFALALDDQLTSEGEVRLYADLVRDADQFDLIVRGGKTARGLGATVPSVIYPLYPVPGQAKEYAEEALILGLSRQESEFRTDAVSSARAKGLMQLIDSTARLTARKEGAEYDPYRLTTDPNYNMVLGSMHLSHLLERFGGSYVMVLAAYNAGPHRVDQWVRTYCDPRDADIDPIDWIELIPFSETRNYVMRVLENTQVYRSRLTGLPLGIQLADDLTRGGVTSFASIGQPRSVPALFDAAMHVGAPIVTPASLDQLPLALLNDGSLNPDAASRQPVSVSNR
jgi:soluble lytic murein transglycosylase